MPRSSLRTRNKPALDYSKLGEVEGLSDDDIGLPKNKFDSDSDGYNEDAAEQEAADEDDDVDMGDAVDEDEDEAEPEEPDDVVDFDEDTKSRKGKSGDSFKSVELPPLRKKKVTTLSSLAGDSSPPKSPADSRKGQRGENLRDRIALFYGENESQMIKAVYDRENLGSHPFGLKRSLIAEPDEMAHWVDSMSTLPSAESVYTVIESKDTALPLDEDEVLVQTEQAAELGGIKSFKSVKNTASQSIVVNTGLPVTALSWAPGHAEHQYLSVGTLNNMNPLDNEDRMSSISAVKRSSFPSTIQIYEISTTLESRLYLTITTVWGSPACLKWRPSLSISPSLVGIMACAFQDGNIRVFDVPKVSSGHEEPSHMKLEVPLFEYKLNAKIVAICWRTPNIISVGTSSGDIAEFDITDEGETANSPSFIYPLHDSLVTDIVSGFPDEPNLLFTLSTDGFSKVIDVRDLRRSKAASSRLKGFSLNAAYAYQIRSFVSLEDSLTTKLNPIRKLDLIKGGTSVTRHNGGVVQSVAASLLHPLIISGASDGSLNVGNSLRRTLLTKRLTNTFYRQANLWTLEVNTTKPDKVVYRFTDNNRALEIGKRTGVEQLPVHPYQVAIMQLAWNPNPQWGGVYAAGTMSGMIRIENMCIE